MAILWQALRALSVVPFVSVAADDTDIPPLPEPGLLVIDRRPTGSGCRTAAAVGCGVLLLVLVAASWYVVQQADELVRWGLGVSQREILAGLADDVTSEEADELRSAFTAIGNALASGEVNRQGLRTVQDEIGRAVRLAQEDAMGSEDVSRLVAALRSVASGTAAGQ